MRQVYKNINILDGTKDMKLQEKMMMIVEDGIIKTICKDDPNIEGKDLNNRYVIPGLINLHVHTPGNGFPKKKQTDAKKIAKLVMSNALLRNIGKMICRSSLKTQLLSGTTTIRTVGGLGTIDSELKKEVINGKTIGPRVISCDEALTVPNGHMEGSVAYGAKDDADFVRFIKESANRKVDWLKIMITGGVLDAKVKGEPGEMKMTPEQVKLCCDTAHELGLKVCAHVESPKGVEVALKNGVDSIEHGADMSDEIVNLFKEKNAVLVSTISPAIPLSMMDQSQTGADEVQVYNSKVLFEGIVNGTKKCLENNVTVGMGTDTVCPYITHYDMWRELEYFHLLTSSSRQEALHHATLVNATILGLENKIGSIETNKSADFVVLDKNPLLGFDALRNPYMVVFNGKEYLNPKIKKSKVAEKELDKCLETLRYTSV